MAERTLTAEWRKFFFTKVTIGLIQYNLLVFGIPYYFFFMYCRLSWTISIVQAWSATKHMIISVVHTPPMPPPWMDYGNYPMFGNLYMIWSFDLPIFVVNYVSPQLIKKKSFNFRQSSYSNPDRWIHSIWIHRQALYHWAIRPIDEKCSLQWNFISKYLNYISKFNFPKKNNTIILTLVVW